MKNDNYRALQRYPVRKLAATARRRNCYIKFRKTYVCDSEFLTISLALEPCETLKKKKKKEKYQRKRQRTQ